MASFWFLTLLLKCIDFLSWPVLALGYPLYASIEAIENDSHSDTRNLISYWILLSLIYLFEYPFLKLLQWFQYWHYMKLIMVAFLVIPDFGRSAYVYNHFVQSCIHMNPQAVISRFRNWKNIFVKKEDFTMQAEKYITRNGTEVLEQLIASKNIEKSLNAETRKSVPTAEKNEILKANFYVNLDGCTNRGRLLMEQKDAKDLEMIENEQVPEGKQVNSALERLKSNESILSATEKMAADTEHGTYNPQISASENVQKEWTCAICQLTMPSEANLNSHVQGRKHKAACEALNTKTKGMPVTDTGSGASSQVNTAMDRFQSNESTSPAMAKTEKMAADTEHGTYPQISASENVQKEWTCAICQLTMASEANLNSHVQGRKHKAACEALNTKTKGMPVTDTGSGASSQVNTAMDRFKSNESTSPAMAKTEKMAADTEHGTYPQISASENVQKEWTCAICQLTMASEANLNSHVQGRKHKAACEALNTKTKGTPVTDTGRGASSQVSACKDVQTMWTCKICQLRIFSEASLNSHLQGRKHMAACEALNGKTKGMPVTDTGSGASSQVNTAMDRFKSNESTSPAMAKTEKMAADTEHGTYPQISASENVQKEWTCAICQLTMASEANLNSHVQGRKHKAACEALNTKTKGTPVTDTGRGASSQVSACKDVQTMWTCKICQLRIFSEASLNSHLQGRKHMAACEALNGKTKGMPVTDTGSGASSQVNTAMDRFKSNESTSPAMAKTEKMAADTEHGTYPQISASENVQKEWTCAICQLTMASEANLNSHVQGRKHKAACEALNTKTKGTPVTDTGRGASSQVSACKDVQTMWTCKICQLRIFSEASLNSHLQGRKHMAACEALNGKTKGTEVTDTGSGASSQVSASKDVQKMWTCKICQLKIYSEGSLNSHLKGKKHKAACEALNAKSQLVAEIVPVKKNDESTGEEEMIIYTPSALEQNTTNSNHPKMEHKNVETINVSQQNKIKDVDANTTKVEELQKKVGTSIGMNSSRLRCDMCNAKCTSEGDLASHLQGSKHLAQIQLLTAHGVL